MNNADTALENFIQDLDLRHADGVVYFHADVYLLINGNEQVLTSEVHIITSDNLNTLYINDLDSQFYQIPEMFETKKQVFTYADKQLRISAGSGDKAFSLSISPKDK